MIRRRDVLGLCYALILGVLLGLANIYLGLKLGFTVGVALLTVFALAGSNHLLLFINQRWSGFSKIEYACYQSLASAMSYGAGTVLATAFAAIVMAKQMPDHPWLIALWLSAICGLGSLVAFSIREKMLANYSFPSGRVAGESVLHILQGRSVRQFFVVFSLSGLWTLIKSLTGWIPEVFLSIRQFGFSSSPMLWGLGAILGMRTCLSMFLGGILAFVLLPYALGAESEKTIQWMSVSAMVVASVGELLMQSLRRKRVEQSETDYSPRSLYVWLPFVLVIAAVSLAIFRISWQLLLIAILAIPAFALVSTRVTGETDVVPTGALGKLSLLLFGLIPGLGSGAMVGTAILAGTSAASSDFMTDLRCGDMLSCPPIRQLRYQLVGAVVGPFIFVPIVWYALMSRYELGGPEFPAPAAQIWLDVWALTRDVGLSDPKISFALGWGALVGCVGMAFSQFHVLKKWMPSIVPMAFAVFLDPVTLLTLLAGAIMGRLMGRRIWDTAIAMVAGESIFIWFSFPFLG